MTKTEIQDAAHAGEDKPHFFIDYPTTGWMPYPLRKALLTDQGELQIPELANLAIRTALVYVRTIEEEPARITRMECEEWLIDATGRVNQENVMRGILERLNPVEGAKIDHSFISTVPISKEDIAAMNRHLGIDVSPPPTSRHSS
ncbi:MAG: hypothetical protein PHH47_08625 [Gallionella sp.]|nr:hypothetical protein [Gallionella sp.]MDD4945890.1 hypothetical protein [Gallionella sp.]MDD5611835.1 hypothetical protein [Gallionella sp.]